jgi:hypothetical protein
VLDLVLIGSLACNPELPVGLSFVSWPLWQVLAKNADNVKAKFRKGKALGELGFFEKATAALEELLKASEEGPGGGSDCFTDVVFGLRHLLDAPAIKAELQRFKVMEKEVTKKADTKMRG